MHVVAYFFFIDKPYKQIIPGDNYYDLLIY